MWQGRVKLVIGIWLILSGFVPVLRHPINMIVVGIFTAICCFSSYRIWQAVVIGVIGLWLFLSGMHDIASLSSRIMASSLNLFSTGIIILALAIWFIVVHSRQISEKEYLKES
ncbi:MAG: hypothetical protein P8Y60_01950 [Calditrichota bacterium]|jgi:hypothetical protein